MVENRQYIEKLIYDAFDILDESGSNANKYRSQFSVMSDKEFEKFMKVFLNNPEENFSFDIVEFERELSMENCEKFAKFIGFELYEYVYFPHLTMDKSRVVRSKEKCLVGKMNVKRTQQLLYKKTGLAISNEKRSALTNQVTLKDKQAKDSDIEASMLVSMGANYILQELHGPRSDDNVMKRQMNQSINTRGFVLLDELDNVSTNKTTLNTVNTFLLSMMIQSDLVTPTYILPKTSSELVG